MPGLARTHDRGGADLLRWRARPHGLMLASIGARGGGEDPVYGYLRLLAAAEADHELGRLLYVGATRAKRRLHLVATADTAEDRASGQRTWKAPASRSALAKIWDAIAHQRPEPENAPSRPDNAPAASPPALRRLPITFALPALPATTKFPPGAEAAAATAPPFDWAHATAAAIGTVTHRLFANLAREGIPAFDGRRIAGLTPRIRGDLIAEGVGDAELDTAAADVGEALHRVIDDARGRWLFDPLHADAASEWALAGIDAGTVVHVTLDRTFVADGVRWIVDFKTGRHEGGDPEAFLAREVDRYRPQLERYARVVRGLDARPIRLGLYYPLVAEGWREWPFAP